MNSKIVFGVSTINHKSRVKFDLTNDQYVVLDLITYWKKNQTKPLSVNDIHRKIGITATRYKEIQKELIGKKLLRYNDQKRLEVSEEWSGKFDFDKDFEEFWLIFKKGNKAKARENYKKCRLLVDKDTLHKAGQSRVKAQDDMKFLPHTSTWLSPTNKHWEDEVEVEEKKPGVAGNFMKTSI